MICGGICQFKLCNPILWPRKIKLWIFDDIYLYTFFKKIVLWPPVWDLFSSPDAPETKLYFLLILTIPFFFWLDSFHRRHWNGIRLCFGFPLLSWKDWNNRTVNFNRTNGDTTFQDLLKGGWIRWHHHIVFSLTTDSANFNPPLKLSGENITDWYRQLRFMLHTYKGNSVFSAIRTNSSWTLSF